MKDIKIKIKRLTEIIGLTLVYKANTIEQFETNQSNMKALLPHSMKLQLDCQFHRGGFDYCTAEL